MVREGSPIGYVSVHSYGPYFQRGGRFSGHPQRHLYSIGALALLLSTLARHPVSQRISAFTARPWLWSNRGGQYTPSKETTGTRELTP